LVNRIPHLSAVVALYGLANFPRVDVYDLSGVPGFTGTPVPSTMFDDDTVRWFRVSAGPPIVVGSAGPFDDLLPRRPHRVP